MFSHLWIDETNCQLFLDYIAQYRQEGDDNKGMFKEKPLHDFTNHAADVHRYAAVIEDAMSNESDQPMPDQEEADSDIYDVSLIDEVGPLGPRLNRLLDARIERDL